MILYDILLLHYIYLTDLLLKPNLIKLINADVQLQLLFHYSHTDYFSLFLFITTDVSLTVLSLQHKCETSFKKFYFSAV